MKKSKGKLMVIGGAIDKGSFTEQNFKSEVSQNLNFFETGVLKRVIMESELKEDSQIEIVTTASRIPLEVGKEYTRAFNFLNAKNVNVMNIQKREEANEEENIKRLKSANVIMFTGGDQLRLSTIIGGTTFHKVLLEKYQKEPFVYVGTSAGAAAASDAMIYQGSSSEALLKGEVKITSGLGLIDDVVIDTHFVQRGRIGRLFQAVVSNPNTLGIGLGEDTGLIIKHGVHMEAIGSGLVIIVDGYSIKDTNLTEVEMGKPISIKNLTVHVMSNKDIFNFETRDLEIYTHKAKIEDK